MQTKISKAAAFSSGNVRTRDHHWKALRLIRYSGKKLSKRTKKSGSMETYGR